VKLWARKGSNLRPRDYESHSCDVLTCVDIRDLRSDLRILRLLLVGVSGRRGESEGLSRDCGIITRVPTYRYKGPHDPEYHTVVADSYKREPSGGVVVVFMNPRAFDGNPYPASLFSLGVIVAGDVELVT
jgi:hypothetical protein